MRAIAVVSLIVVAGAVGMPAEGGRPAQTVARADRAERGERAKEVTPATPDGWSLFEAPEASFSILLPTHRRTAEAEDGGVVVHVVQARALDGCEYAVLWSDTGEATTADGLVTLLTGIAEGRGVSTDHGGFETGPDRRSGLSGHKVRGVSDRAEMDLRAFADGPRLYQLYAQCPRETALDTQGRQRTSFELAEAERRAFFASFSVKK